MEKLSIYIHIPFCIKKCRYCDFLSFSPKEGMQEAYIQALLKEIEAEASKYRTYEADTVFLGGGTPSLLSGEQMKKIMERIRGQFTLSSDPEITVEMNPGTADRKKLADYREAGINRLSIGTQSVQDRELALLGRIHKAEDFFRIYQEAREEGFSNINVDLMAALPGQSAEDYLETLKQVAALEPEHISAYSLIIEEGTPFYELYGDGKKKRTAAEALPSEEEERYMDALTEKYLKDKGYHRYEISNYAREGKECRHNITYWKRYDYAGFGLGAASMVNNIRWKNTSLMADYLEEKEKKEEIQVLGRPEQMEEFMFLGLRLTEGIDREEFRRYFHSAIEAVYGEKIEKLRKEGLLEVGERIRLTPYGRDISNYVMSQFLF